MSVEQPDLAAPAQTDDPSWHRRPAKKSFAHVLNLLFVVLGVFFLVGGYNAWAAVQPIAGGTTTTGTVASVSSYTTCGRYGCTTHWTPTIQFDASDGTSYTFVGPTTGIEGSEGDTVSVSYLAADPTVAHDISASDGEGVAYIGFGVFAVVLGLGSFILGFAALHRRTGLSSARPGSGWVGHKSIHSNQGMVVAIAVILALVVAGFFVV